MCARARARLWKPTRCTRPSLSEPIRRPAAKLSLRPAGRAKTHPSESTVRRRAPRVLGNTDRGSKTRTWIRRLGFNDSESETRIRRLGFGDSDSKSRIRRLGFGDSDSGTRIRRLGWGLGRECPPLRGSGGGSGVAVDPGLHMQWALRRSQTRKGARKGTRKGARNGTRKGTRKWTRKGEPLAQRRRRLPLHAGPAPLLFGRNLPGSPRQGQGEK